jgi:hypothetical protein
MQGVEELGEATEVTMVVTDQAVETWAGKLAEVTMVVTDQAVEMWAGRLAVMVQNAPHIGGVERGGKKQFRRQCR